jgi:hypothetical protein
MSDTYKGTYNPSKKRGELLKDGMSTGDYFSDLNEAQDKAAQMNADERRKAKSEERKPVVEGLKKAVGMKAGGTASSRADGCAIRGKTKGKIV